MVLSYVEKDTRKPFARSMGHDNWELNVVDNDPEDLVSSIACIHDGVCGGKKPCRPAEHVLSMEEAVSLFGVQGMGPPMLTVCYRSGLPRRCAGSFRTGPRLRSLLHWRRTDKRAEEADRRMTAPSGNRRGRRGSHPAKGFI